MVKTRCAGYPSLVVPATATSRPNSLTAAEGGTDITLPVRPFQRGRAGDTISRSPANPVTVASVSCAGISSLGAWARATSGWPIIRLAARTANTGSARNPATERLLYEDGSAGEGPLRKLDTHIRQMAVGGVTFVLPSLQAKRVLSHGRRGAADR